MSPPRQDPKGKEKREGEQAKSTVAIRSKSKAESEEKSLSSSSQPSSVYESSQPTAGTTPLRDYRSEETSAPWNSMRSYPAGTYPAPTGEPAWPVSPGIGSPHGAGMQGQMTSQYHGHGVPPGYAGPVYPQSAQFFDPQSYYGPSMHPTGQPYGPVYQHPFQQYPPQQSPVYGPMIPAYPAQQPLGPEPWNSANMARPGHWQPPTASYLGRGEASGRRNPSRPGPQSDQQAASRTDSDLSGASMTLRGPPRKPKQSGFALWCGNLPAQAHIVDLKNHFSRGATDDIESVFLIAKTNCAFVNYSTEEACKAAQTRFHDQRFHGAKLVCRLRRGASATLMESTQQIERDAAYADKDIEEGNKERVQQEATSPKGFKERFFIIKSLTNEDLRLSVQTGSWATQSHNEANLTEAFKSAENVYLIFSANKSGEYFGYARMLSPIDESTAPSTDPMPGHFSSLAMPTDSSLITPTPATEHAPKGCIIDDPARGTIFWEAVREGEAAADKKESEEDSEAVESEPDTDKRTLGHAFRIDWISTNKIPFHKARGLKNPLNQNREVKIARDGTEIEPVVGRRLISLFHSPPYAAGAPGSGPVPGYGPSYSPGSGLHPTKR